MESVDVDRRVFVDVTGREISMTWLGSAVSSNVEVVDPCTRSDQAEVFAFGFRAFARATAHCGFSFVRRAESFVSMLDPNGEDATIANAVAAPGASHTALHGS